MNRRYGEWPKRTKARPVADGIKAHTKRGAFGQRWWAKRWIGVLESFGLGARLSRGRSYARGGQVFEIAIECGGVRAKVQGSRAQPYDVTIRMRELKPREWSAIGTAIAANARLSAMLLAGEMPQDIETAFAAAGASVFPRAASELKMACSCPDWSNPCKHVAAVFYLVGEEFDRDPFLLFVVRGLERDAVAQLLAGPDSAPAKGERLRGKAGERASAPTEYGEAAPAEPLPFDPAAFWIGGTKRTSDAAPLPPPQAQAMLVTQAGRFPFWRSDVPLHDAVAPVYVRATQSALDWLAEHPDPDVANESGTTSARRVGIDPDIKR